MVVGFWLSAAFSFLRRPFSSPVSLLAMAFDVVAAAVVASFVEVGYIISPLVSPE